MAPLGVDTEKPDVVISVRFQDGEIVDILRLHSRLDVLSECEILTNTGEIRLDCLVSNPESRLARSWGYGMKGPPVAKMTTTTTTTTTVTSTSRMR